jgi:CRISPR-associated protein Cmr4
MTTTMLGFLAESSIHCGAGRSAGIIDLPVAREAATDYPFIAGSGLKGALRDRARGRRDKDDLERIFGKPDRAGQVLVSDARLLLLPVRSLTGAYRWVTCPLILERLGRDLARCGASARFAAVTVPPGRDGPGVLGAGKVEDKLYLEERELTIAGPCPDGVIAAIQPFVRHRDTRARLARQVAIVSDDDFSWFCRYAIPIQARNVLKNDGSKQSENLWYEESLPPDTVLYALAIAHDDATRRAVVELFPDADPYLQIGGNETVGHGWVAVAIHGGAAS